jgi:hypothetical protein
MWTWAHFVRNGGSLQASFYFHEQRGYKHEHHQSDTEIISQEHGIYIQ